nr:MAG TPA: hypothetical protein [Caudoviricetes sp.]
MANNKVQLSDGTVLLDLTGDTVTPETLMSGVTAHNAAGEQIVGAVTAGGITNFPTIEEVRANWTAVDLVTHPVGDVIPIFPSGTILAFIIGKREDALDRGIVFLEVKQNQEFGFWNLCNEGNGIYVFELYLYQGAIAYDIAVEDVLGGDVIPDTTIQSVIYYTTADNFFSK